MRPEPRLRRRRAARPDQLPQLRQPREARRRLAARQRGQRPRRGVQGARRPGGRRQRLALQRDRARPDLSRRRSSAWSGELPDPAVAPGAGWSEGDEIVLVGPFAPSLAGLGAGEAPRRARRRAAGDRDRARSRPRSRFVREVVREGGVSGAHDVSDGGLAAALAEMAIAGERRGRDRPRPLRRAARLLGRDGPVRRGPGRDPARRPGAERRGARRARARDAGRRRRRHRASRGATGSRSRPPSGRCRSLMADAAAAWRSLGETMDPPA